VKRKPSQAAVAVVIGVLLVLAVAASYFLLISPQRSKAADLQKEADAARQELSQLRAVSLESRETQPIRVADLFRLTKAIPDEVDMPGMILELNRIARETGIRFDSITPQAPADSTNGYQVVPINLVFQGNYFELSDFLYRVRSLVGVRGGRLDATGRLFVVGSVAFSEGVKKFPQIQATLTVSAYVFGASTAAGAAPVAPPASPAPPAPESPDTPPATPPAPSGASAAGATS
jgi:type II secretory pathway pseudopilin PulG